MPKNGMTAREYARLAEKLHRLAYDLEHDANRLAASSNYSGDASAVRSVSSQLGDIARGMK